MPTCKCCSSSLQHQSEQVALNTIIRAIGLQPDGATKLHRWQLLEALFSASLTLFACA